MKVIGDASLLQEVSEFFSFRPNGYQFNPRFKARIWDGYIRLITPFKPYLYVGLLDHLKKFCSDRDYEIEIDEELSSEEDIPDDYGYVLAKELNAKYIPRDYQNDYVVQAIRKKRMLILSPTSCLDPKTIIELDLDDRAQEFLKKLRK